MVRADIKLYRGDDKRLKFSLTQNCKPFNVEDCRFSLTVSPEADGEPFTLTTEDGNIQAFENYAVVHFSHTLTRDAQWRRGQYDLQMTGLNGEVTTVVAGRITLTHDITR